MPKPIRPRRAPWTENGKPVLLVAEPGGTLDKEADAAETRMISNARGLLNITERMSDEMQTPEEFEFVVTRLREALSDVINVCDARAARS